MPFSKVDTYLEQTEFVRVSKSSLGNCLSTCHEIPQIDVSMHLPSYRGSGLPLVGCVVLCSENPQELSAQRPFLFLFQAYSPEEFQMLCDGLQSIECIPEGLLPLPPERQYPLQICDVSQVLQQLPPFVPYLRICARAPRATYRKGPRRISAFRVKANHS